MPDGVQLHHGDPRVPDPPADLVAVLDDPAQAAIGAAYWRLGYAAALDRPRTWRDDIPAGVRILHDPDFHTTREG